MIFFFGATYEFLVSFVMRWFGFGVIEWFDFQVCIEEDQVGTTNGEVPEICSSGGRFH